MIKKMALIIINSQKDKKRKKKKLDIQINLYYNVIYVKKLEYILEDQDKKKKIEKSMNIKKERK